VKGQMHDKVVKGISRNTAEQIKFDHNGRKISVLDYHTNVLGVSLKYPKGPMLQLGPTTFVPAEVCVIS
jgi:eukaryotic translation initiation factor 2C